MQEHNGVIEVFQRPGGGTRFHLEFPGVRKAGQCLKLRCAEERQAVTTKARVLVVDDESEIRESLELLLNMEGYSVRSRAQCHRGRQEARCSSFTTWCCSMS